MKNSSEGMSKEDIIKYLELLNDKLRFRGKTGELSMVGGAVMCVCFDSRISTMDVDALFEPQYIIYQCAKEIAEEYGLPHNWLNDGVSVYLSKEGKYRIFLSMSNLKVYVAVPEYMLAMKCLSARLYNQNEMDDIRVLIKSLGIKSLQEVRDIIDKYYSSEVVKLGTWEFIKEILEDGC